MNNHWISIILGAAAVLGLSSCDLKGAITSVDADEFIYAPLISYSPPADPDDLKLYSVWYDGSGGVTSEVYTTFGYSTNGSKWGNFSYNAQQSISLKRQEVPGPCSAPGGTAPNCAFTWGVGGTGLYRGRNTNLFPAMANNLHQWSKLKYISADLRMDLVTGYLHNSGGFAACGLNLGFGELGDTHVNLPALPVALDIANRGSKRDMIMIGPNILTNTASTDRFRIELPVNSSSGSGITTVAVWDSSFDMLEASPLTTNGDYVTYRLRLDFNHTTDVMKITITPLATNKNLALMNQQILYWDVFAPHTYTVGGEARPGIATDHGGNGFALSKDQVRNSKVAVGFHSNGVTKLCEMSNMIIGAYD